MNFFTSSDKIHACTFYKLRCPECDGQSEINLSYGTIGHKGQVTKSHEDKVFQQTESTISVSRKMCNSKSTCLALNCDQNISFNPPMAKGGGGGCHPPQQVFPISLRNGKSFLQTKFLPVGSSLGHLPMKKFFKSDLPSWL